VRPRYEMPKDLTREAEFSRVVGQKFYCTFSKMPDRYGLDFCMLRDGAVTAFAEVKVRSNPRDKYPTYMIALSKVMSANGLNAATGLPCFLLVRWTDCWGYVRLDGKVEQGSLSVGGRTDRGDPQDVEPVSLIPTSRFSTYPA
jgi:hypothetical protein